MYPFRRILIPTDFSTASQWAFDDAIRLGSLSGAELIVLHIRLTWAAQPGALRLPADASLYEYAERHELALLKERIRRANANVTTRMIVRQAPDPSKEISRTASAEEVDLIVMATHGSHSVAHLIIGSTTQATIMEPPAPVLTVRYGTRKRSRISRILVPVHPKQTSRAALDLATEIARQSSCTIELVTVCAEKDRRTADKELADIVQALGVTANPTVIASNDVDDAILKFADKKDVDAILLNASSELTDLKAAIVRHANVPVMIVP